AHARRLPLRLQAAAFHPIAYAMKWLVMRPIHFVVSQPSTERVFGHTPHETPFGDYEAYPPDADEWSSHPRGARLPVTYERKDAHYRRAKAEGFRARSAYKLAE